MSSTLFEMQSSVVSGIAIVAAAHNEMKQAFPVSYDSVFRRATEYVRVAIQITVRSSEQTEIYNPLPGFAQYREIRPPTPRSETTVCAVTSGDIAELVVAVLVAVLIFCCRFERSGTRKNSAAAERVSVNLY